MPSFITDDENAREEEIAIPVEVYKGSNQFQ
jgi:hypothetical protein